MKVIFKDTQEVKEVKFGYAVNYLIPNGLAILATKEALSALETKKKHKVKKQQQDQEEAEKLLQKICQKKLIIKAKAKKDKSLFGKITKARLKKEIETIIGKEKSKISPKIEILLDEPIKKLGKQIVGLKIKKSRGNLQVEVVKE